MDGEDNWTSRDSAQLRLMISIIFVPLISGSVEMNL